MLAEIFKKVASEFVYERAKPFAGNGLADLIRRELTDEAKKRLIFRKDEYKVKGSAGAGNWAAVPWLAFFDSIITETAQKGFYVVYLINPQSQVIYLSLNQGTTEVHQEYGRAYLDVLRRRADDMRQRIFDLVGDFEASPIDLGSTEQLPAGYEAGHIIGRAYHFHSITDRQLDHDLQRMLNIYQSLIFRGGSLPSEIMFEEVGSKDINECRRYVLSKRIERSPRVRREVLAAKQLVCEGCGLDPKLDYRYVGHPVNTPLEVHHLTALKSLNEGESRRYTIPDDFAVHCPTCHRVAHKQGDPSDMEQLKDSVRFKHLREVF